jgi:hypothetical protein
MARGALAARCAPGIGLADRIASDTARTALAAVPAVLGEQVGDFFGLVMVDQVGELGDQRFDRDTGELCVLLVRHIVVP